MSSIKISKLAGIIPQTLPQAQPARFRHQLRLRTLSTSTNVVDHALQCLSSCASCVPLDSPSPISVGYTAAMEVLFSFDRSDHPVLPHLRNHCRRGTFAQFYFPHSLFHLHQLFHVILKVDYFRYRRTNCERVHRFPGKTLCHFAPS